MRKKKLKITKGDGLKNTLDIIGIIFWFMEQVGVQQDKLDNVRNQLNNCFLEESFGYQINGNQIMRIDSEFHHREVIERVLVFLRDSEFKSANKEFLSAHEHYRNGRYGDCITNASSAFETVIKIICDDNNWNYGNRTGKNLVLFLLDKDEFIPKYLRSHFEQLVTTLWSGLFATRNNQPPGHGQGKKTEVYAYMAGYALHLAAANILLLVQIYESQKQSLKTT